MPSGRKANPAPKDDHSQVDVEALAKSSSAMTALHEQNKEITDRYGDGLPYDRARVVSEARFFMGASAEAMLEAGKRLILLKENEPHGEFTEIVEERLGLSISTAQKLMRAAVKYLAPALGAKAPTSALLLLGRSKLLELVTEPDEDIAALAAGGTIAGLDLDDMQAMTARELRAALVEARQAAAAKDKVIAKKDAKLNKLAEEAELRKALGSDDQATLDTLRDVTTAAEIALAQLASAISGVMSSSPSEATATAARHAAEYVAQRLADLINDHGISVDVDEMLTPHWLSGAEAQAALGEAKPARGTRKRGE
jgi:hypothetical protein